MKITCLVFMLIAFASLTPGTSMPPIIRIEHPNSHLPRPQRTHSAIIRMAPSTPLQTMTEDLGKTETPSDERRDHRHISDKNHPRSLAP